MNFYNLNIYNKTFLFVGSVLGFTGTYLDVTKKVENFYIIMAFLLLGLMLTLLSFKKPKASKNDGL